MNYEQIAKTLWPNLILEERGKRNDFYGCDGYLSGDRVQIKYDSAIPRTGNIYHEIYEKTASKPSQNWRTSMAKVAWYIFTTETQTQIMGWKISVNELAKAEMNMALEPITPNYAYCTSIGFIIPLTKLKYEHRAKSKARL